MIPFPEGISPDIFTIAIGNFKFTLYWYALAYVVGILACLLYTSPSPRDKRQSRMPSSA